MPEASIRAARTVEKAPLGRRAKAVVEISRMLFRASPLTATAGAVLTIASYVTSPLSTVELARVIGAVAAHDERAAMRHGIAIGALALLGSIVGTAGFRLRMRMREVGGHALLAQIADTVAGIPGTEHLERPDVADKVDLLQGGFGQMASTLDALMQNVGAIVGTVVTLTALAQVSPWFLFLVAFGAPTLWAGARSAGIMADLQERLTPLNRRLGHLRDVLEDAATAGEVRVFGLSDELQHRHRGHFDEMESLRTPAIVRSQSGRSGAWLLFAAGYIGALALVLHRAIEGTATATDVAIVTGLGPQVRGALQSLVGMTNWLVSTSRSSERHVWMRELADEANRTFASGVTDAPVPTRIRDGIDLVDVGFTYPGTEAPVLHGATVHLPAGATVAIVGDNGAGKSTLVKLLSRFYEPTTGEILVDGVPMRSFEIDAWREQTSASFQEFARLHLQARVAIGLGDHPTLLGPDGGEAAVRAAVARATAEAMVADLPDGLETQLGTAFGDGVEMSGGQWHKTAIARSMMRPLPLLLLLDEPTAALDAQAEHDLFERYAGAAGDAARLVGGITVIVSHRFSTVRMADLILVVDGGTIACAGTHDELMAAGGLYAELYDLQARAYR